MQVKKAVKTMGARFNKTLLQKSVLALDIFKSSVYTCESVIQPLFKGSFSIPSFSDLNQKKLYLEKLYELHEKDSICISQHFKNFELLQPQKIVSHVFRLPQMYFDDFKEAIMDKSDTYHHHPYPDYYSEKYIKEQNQDQFEHQQEWQLSGAASGLRRQIIPYLKSVFPHSQGEGLNFLELGCGSAQLTYFVKQVFPKARVVVVDINPKSLKRARKNLEEFHGVDFFQADITHLPFTDAKFDVVMSSFLFLELPQAVRKQVLSEAARVLVSQGRIALVDSMQKEDFDQDEISLSLSPYKENAFWLDYQKTSMEGLLHLQDFNLEYEKHLFFSKVLGGQKNS